jgi:hypothetical protein
MPGGLARIAGNDRHAVSGQRGGGSKDTWVLSATPTDSAVRPIQPAHAVLGQQTTSSRAAEHLFWLGRYAERSENVARLLRAVLLRTTDIATWPAGGRAVLARVVREHGLIGASDGSLTAPDLVPGAAWPIARALINGL